MKSQQKKILNCLMLLPLSVSVFAKNPLPNCVGSTGSSFTFGDGSSTSPYLICNKDQVNHLATDASLLNKNFVMGADINFSGGPFSMIGSATTPFEGRFDGNGYSWSFITINQSATPESAVAPFAYVENARINGLTINTVNIPEYAFNNVGGMIGLAENAVLTDLHVENLDISAPDHSGGLVGHLENSSLSFSSAQGIARQHFGTDAGGGLVGYAFDSDISVCSADVEIVTTASSPYGVSDIGGLVGIARDTAIRNVYALGNIDYSYAGGAPGPRRVGGLVGSLSGGFLQYAYYAGKMTINAEFKGGAVSTVLSPSPLSISVFWDKEVSTVSTSALGVGKTTAAMQRKTFWVNKGFSTRYWSLANGRYPKFYE